MNAETKLALASITLGAIGCALVVVGLGGPRSTLAQLGLGVIAVVASFSLFALAWKGRE